MVFIAPPHPDLQTIQFTNNSIYKLGPFVYEKNKCNSIYKQMRRPIKQWPQWVEVRVPQPKIHRPRLEELFVAIRIFLIPPMYLTWVGDWHTYVTPLSETLKRVCIVRTAKVFYVPSSTLGSWSEVQRASPLKNLDAFSIMMEGRTANTMVR